MPSVLRMNCTTECPVCSKMDSIPTMSFLLETTCPHCKFCYEPVFYFDSVHLFRQEAGFGEWFADYIVNSNNHHSYEDFKLGVDNKKLVALFPLVEPSSILEGWRLGAFNLLVTLYRVGPIVASLLAWYFGHSAWYLSGIMLPALYKPIVGMFLRNTLQQVQVVLFFLIIAGIFGYFLGMYHWIVFALVCVAFRLGGYFFADAMQGRLARGALYSDPIFFAAVIGTAKVFVAPAKRPSFMKYRKWH